MITFIRIVLFLMLKQGMLSKDGKAGNVSAAIVWDSMLTVPGMLSIEADPNTIEDAITACSLYNALEINRQTDQSNGPIPVVRVTMRFDTMKPEIQKQISERLLGQFQGRITFNWNNTLLN